MLRLHRFAAMFNQKNLQRCVAVRSLLSAGICASIMCLAPQSAAQNEAPESEALEIEEVIVTTERRETSVQDLAATVAVFDDDDLLKLALNSDFSNLQYAVPGLQIAKQEGKIEVYLRGIGSSDSDFSSDPSVAVHYNGVYLPRPRGIGPLFFDSERVEINVGPQGTLRGRNATGGTINIISKKPDFDAVTGEIQGGIGNFNGRELQGIVNLPVSETLATRFSVWSKFHDGLYSNAFGGGRDFRTPSEQDDLAWRASLRWEPDEFTSVNAQFFRADVRSTGDPGVFAGRSLAFGYDIDDLSDPWDQYFRTEGNFEQDVETALIQLVRDVGDVSFEYNGSVNDLRAYNSNASREFQLGFNFPGSQPEADFIASGADEGRNLLVNNTFSQGDRSKSYSHELRVSSIGDGALQWQAGLFSFEEEFDYFSWDVSGGNCFDSSTGVGTTSQVGPNTITCNQNGLGGENRGDNSEVESLAFFMDGSYQLTDRINLKAGYRYTDDQKTQRDSNAQYQFNFNSDFFFGFPGIDEGSDLVIGEQGFTITGPGERTLLDYRPNESGLAFFQDAVAEYGLGDNWGVLLDACREGFDCEVIVTSVFDPDGQRGTIRATNGVRNHYQDWRLGFEFDLSDSNFLYSTVSTGTRSGGINRPIVLGVGRQGNREWAPEELTAYEFGTKNDFLWRDRPVLVNASLFYYDYTNLVSQVLVDEVIPIPGTDQFGTTQQVLTDNVADASIVGLELQTRFDLPWNIVAETNLTWLDSEYKNSSITDPRSTNNLPINIDGNELQNVSRWNLNLRFSQNIDFTLGAIESIDWTVNVLYRSKFFLTPFNDKGYRREADGSTTEIPLSEMNSPLQNETLAAVGGDAGPEFFSDDVPGFFIVNASAGVNFGETGQYRVDGYVENLFEQAYSTKAFVNSSVNIRYLNAPRQFGVRFRAQFD